MPRSQVGVKRKLSIGLVDLHFHGALGVDLVTASPAELETLTERLWKDHAVAAFCPTLLSLPRRELVDTVSRLGAWCARARRREPGRGALPLGLHLEGPFLSASASGAHPPGYLRTATLPELEKLWEASQGTFRILTMAPERHTSTRLREIARWARARGVHLSLGHSRATQAQAQEAFRLGFRGVTHAWNAMPFHHREPGPLGAALGRPDVWVEVIPDGVHVDPTVVDWTARLHPGGTCFVSDCVTPSGQRGAGWYPFGPLRVRLQRGAARLKGGALAGGGRLLSQSYCSWVATRAKATGADRELLFLRTLPFVTAYPLAALGLHPSALRRWRVAWTWRAGQPEPRALVHARS